ncbi:MAG TPA: transposase [Polyangiaceae bacterium]|nr:transposase [Polyangiaceae bacterium]
MQAVAADLLASRPRRAGEFASDGDFCQIGVGLEIATATQHPPIDFELYLPEGWTNDPERRAQAHIPGEVTFKTKVELALGKIERAVHAGIPARCSTLPAVTELSLGQRRGSINRSRVPMTRWNRAPSSGSSGCIQPSASAVSKHANASRAEAAAD